MVKAALESGLWTIEGTNKKIIKLFQSWNALLRLNWSKSLTQLQQTTNYILTSQIQWDPLIDSICAWVQNNYMSLATITTTKRKLLWPGLILIYVRLENKQQERRLAWCCMKSKKKCGSRSFSSLTHQSQPPQNYNFFFLKKKQIYLTQHSLPTQ